VDRARVGLQGAVYLLIDDPRSADDVLDAVLAELLIRRVPPAELHRLALRGLVGDDQPTPVPGAGRPAVELVDGPRDAGRPLVLNQLARLPPSERAAVVLRHYTGLNEAEIADLLGRTPTDAGALADRATMKLQAGQVEWCTEKGLNEALRAAIPYDRRGSRGATRDVEHARRIIGHRRRRLGLGIAAALVLLVLIAQLRPPRATDQVTSSLPTPVVTSAPLPEPPCDPSEGDCQRAQIYAWQTTMAEVISSYVDPGDHYFNVFRTPDDTLNPPGFWVSDGGALAVDLLRRGRGGATQVSMQIATSRRYAIACGRTTHRECISMRFMDGNRFTLTETSRVDEGMEVQFSPDGTQVITAIAYNPVRGEPLTIDRGELIELVQDPRLRLPAR
jgi:hypothetical protein